jgi:hypothetical protein
MRGAPHSCGSNGGREKKMLSIAPVQSLQIEAARALQPRAAPPAPPAAVARSASPRPGPRGRKLQPAALDLSLTQTLA